MTQLIKATPDLVGEEANKFLKKMLAVESSKITLKDKELAKRVADVSRKLKLHNSITESMFQQGKAEAQQEFEKMIDDMMKRKHLILDVKILNESTEDVFCEMLKSNSKELSDEEREHLKSWRKIRNETLRELKSKLKENNDKAKTLT